MRVKKKTHPIPDMNHEALKEFRQAAYELLVKAKDATFELMDAVMTTRNAACLAEFALSPLFNRQWSSSYEALQLLRHILVTKTRQFDDTTDRNSLIAVTQN